MQNPLKQIANGENLTKLQRNMLQMVEKNISILMRLITEILDFRKIQNKKMKLELSEFELTDYLKQWTNTFDSIVRKQKKTDTSCFAQLYFYVCRPI